MDLLMFYGIITVLHSDLVVGERVPLYVGALFELSEHWWASYTNFFPTIVEEAFEDIRNHSNLLDDFELRLVVKDTKGLNGYAAKLMTDLLQEDPPKVAILGPSLSDELTITGQIAPFYNVMELSYVATTASTADKKLFSTLFSINQVSNALNPLRIKMMKHFGWTRVGTISFQTDISVQQMSNFHNLVADNEFSLITSAIVTDTNNIKDVIARFLQFDVRIIIGAFRSSKAPALFCEAYKQGLYGSSYVWVVTGTLMYTDWLQNADLDDIDCTREEIYTVCENYFSLDYDKVTESTSPTINGQTASATMNELQELCDETDYKLTSYAGWIYDTAWSLALGLNNSIEHLSKRNLSLHNYNYSSDYLECITEGMKEVTFSGLSGHVSFDEDGFRVGETFIRQRVNGSLRVVAKFDPITEELTWMIPDSLIWTDGEVPADYFTYEESFAPANSIAVASITTMLTGGFILSISFLAFNTYYRNQRSMKMSSPVMNTIIIVGCLLLYIEVMVATFNYLYLVPGNPCMVRAWLMSIGFTTLFGALFSKTYRVYVIFRDYKCKKRSIRDYQLIIMLCVMLAIDLVILLSWTLVHPMTETRHVEIAKDKVHLNVISSTVYLHCYNSYQGYWLAAIYVYKGLMLAFGLFLAWETRKVNVAELNDSKYIGACVYNVVIICVFGVPLSHALPIEQTTLNFVMESCLIIFCTTICLCIIFVPKVRMRNQVHGKFIITRHTSSLAVSHADLPDTQTTSMSTKRNNELKPFPSTTDYAKMHELKAENENLRMKMAKEAIAMARFRKTLLRMTGDLHMYKSGDEYILFKSSAPLDQSITQEENVDLT